MTDCVLVGFYGAGAAFNYNVKEARPRTKSKAKDPRDLVRRATSKTKPLYTINDTHYTVQDA